MFPARLSLHTPGSVSACQLQDLIHRHHIEISFNGMFQTGCRHRKFNGILCIISVLDYHCHISPQEIAEDKQFENIAQIWLGGDHYKWRQMRSNGIAEEYITGNAPDREKFQKWAETLEKAIGNPLYHWSHLISAALPRRSI